MRSLVLFLLVTTSCGQEEAPKSSPKDDTAQDAAPLSAAAEGAKTDLAPEEGGIQLLARGAKLPACAAALEGRIYFVVESDEFRSCQAGDWEVVDLRGKDGAEGGKGKDGRDGAEGTAGAIGGAGAAGSQGEKGDVGAAGEAGAAGEKGEQGDVGPQGTAGVDGTAGTQGEQGETGAQGIQGVAGADGIDGAAGADGAQGVAGADGAAGAAGADGTDAQTLRLVSGSTYIGDVYSLDKTTNDYWTVRGAMRMEIDRTDGTFPYAFLVFSGAGCTGTSRLMIPNGYFANTYVKGSTGIVVQATGANLGSFSYASRMAQSTNCVDTSGSVSISWAYTMPTLAFTYPVVSPEIEN